MEFKQGTKVHTSDGKDVGSIDRVVLNPNTKKVTHVVVRKGFLFTEDKIVPVGMVASANEDRVDLNRSSDTLDALPPYEEQHYVPLDEAEARSAEYQADLAVPYYWASPMAGWSGFADYGMGVAYPPPYLVETERNVPDNSVVITEGVPVITSDDQHVGNVERVYTQSESNRATHFLLSAGLIFKEKKVIPIGWIHDTSDNEIYLNVNAKTLEHLPEFQES